jgi:hypothetical protein
MEHSDADGSIKGITTERQLDSIATEGLIGLLCRDLESQEVKSQ